MHREKHWSKGRRYFNRRVMDERPCVAVSLVNTPFFCTKTWKPEKKKKKESPRGSGNLFPDYYFLDVSGQNLDCLASLVAVFFCLDCLLGSFPRSSCATKHYLVKITCGTWIKYCNWIMFSRIRVCLVFLDEK